jgi:hypothetical protein
VEGNAKPRPVEKWIVEERVEKAKPVMMVQIRERKMEARA